MDQNINGNTGFVTGEETNTNQEPVVNDSIVSGNIVQQPENVQTVEPNSTETVSAAVGTLIPQSVQAEAPVITPVVSETVPPATTEPVSASIEQASQEATKITGGMNTQSVDPKQSKCKKIFIMAFVILILTVIGVVVGVICFNKFGVKSEPVDESTTVVNNTITSNIISSVDVEAQNLSPVLKLLGISEAQDEENIDALTFYVTDENYRDNAKDIITYYAILGSDMALSEEEASSYKSDKGACSNTEDCAIISKDNALKILKFYDFSGELNDYFFKSEKSDDIYGIHYGSSLVLPKFDGSNLGIGHNLTAKYVGDKDIEIEDKQLFNYNDDESQFKSVNRIVRYTFKKSDDGSYHLDSVLISE